MFSAYPIRAKLLATFLVLLLLVLVLVGSMLYTTYSYRDSVKDLSLRSEELPAAAELSLQVGELRMMVSELRGIRALAFPSHQEPVQALQIRIQMPDRLVLIEKALGEYRYLLGRNVPESDLTPSGDSPDNDSTRSDSARSVELETMARIDEIILQIYDDLSGQSWLNGDEYLVRVDQLLIDLQVQTQKLPSNLHEKLASLADNMRARYRAQMAFAILAGVLTGLLFWVFLGMFYRWVFQPLGVLIDGSRHIASGRFDYRIHLKTQDEMAELANALNNMAERFQVIRDDLDRQVRERTQQAVRSEQLASVGFLAAGVAHEINNPLASIAMCAESLEGRIAGIVGAGAGSSTSVSSDFKLGCDDDDDESSERFTPEDRDIVERYLQMIQEEAFRCKGITERLLDFSRTGPSERQQTDLVALVRSVAEMVSHLGKYQNKQIIFEPQTEVVAPVNPQEIKQIVLNLLTNALDSLDDGGEVRIQLTIHDQMVRLELTDNGCGMTPEVLGQVFEPFFTQRRTGQGTGLGLSITHRIVTSHGGRIEAESEGPGQGSTFRIWLPANDEQVNKAA